MKEELEADRLLDADPRRGQRLPRPVRRPDRRHGHPGGGDRDGGAA
mgnify:CR=1 FL=1